MPRKVDTKRRELIASRAFEVIKEQGVHQTTMSDIAAALNMKRPTLYWYFKDLGAVFDAVLSGHDDQLYKFVLGRLARVDHPVDRLAEVVRATSEFFSSHRDEMMVLFQLWAIACASDPARLERRRRDFIVPVRNALTSELTRGIDRGLVAECDPEVIVDMAMAIIDGAQLQQLIRGTATHPVIEGFCRHTLEPLRKQQKGTQS